MAAPQVVVKEVDLSTRVPAFPGVYGGILIPAKKGPIDKPVLCTSDSQLLKYFTPEEQVKVGYDLAYFSALAFLSRADKLWVQRVIGDGYTFGGMSVFSTAASGANASWSAGLAEPEARTFLTNEAFSLYGKDPGVWNNDIRVKVLTSRAAETVMTKDLYSTISGPLLKVTQSWQTGDAVRLGEVGGGYYLPSPFKTGVTYYVIRVSSTTIKLAASVTDAAAGTPIVPTHMKGTVTSVDAGADAFIMSTDPTIPPAWVSGTPIVVYDNLSNADAVPSPLLMNTVYYIINPNDEVSLKVATTKALALAGTPINLIAPVDSDPLQISEPVAMKLIPVADVPEPGSFKIEVYHKDNLNVPLETHTVSRSTTAKDGFGRNIYLETVLEGSNYVRAVDNTAVSSTVDIKSGGIPIALVGGADGDPVTDSEMINALQKFLNPDDVPLTLVLDGGWATEAYQLAKDTLCAARQDCYSVNSSRYEDEINSDYLNAIVNYRKNILNLSSSYSGIFTPHLKVTDRFNSRKIWVSPDGYAAAAISFTASNFELWFPVGGFRRGILNVEDVQRRFSKGERDYLYDSGINPIRFYPGRGIMIWGQKTLLGRPSALDRQNVRLLLIYIEPAIKTALEDFLFELNDEATRFLAKTAVETYMQNIQARRGV